LNATTKSGRPLASDLEEAVIAGFERAGVKAKHQPPGETQRHGDHWLTL